MATQVLQVGAAVMANPGDDFTFAPPDKNAQYHFEISPPVPAAVIGVWKGTATQGNGVARNKAGVSYVDHVCGAGQFVVTVTGVTAPYVMKVTANPWWKKVFGW